MRSYASSGPNKRNWGEMLKFATFVYNNTVHSTTNFSPHSLTFGFAIQIPTHLSKEKTVHNYSNLMDTVRNNLARSQELARKYLHERKLKNKAQYDKNAKDYEVNVNDLVLVKRQVKDHKFSSVYEGPFRVIESYQCYVIVMKNGKKVKYNKNLIKLAKAEYNNEPPQTTPIVEVEE